MGEVGGPHPEAHRADTEEEEVTPAAEPEPEAAGGVGRRTILLGAAAGAGVVAANVVPTLRTAKAGASPSVAAGPAALAQRSGQVDASQVNVAATGEIPRTNAQDAFSRLDNRLGKTHFIDDLRAAMTVVDDFVGASDVSGSIGQLGWNTAGSGGTTAAVLTGNPPGVFRIGTGSATNGWQNVTLGGNFLSAPTYMMCEWRIKPNVLGTSSCWFGLHDGAGSDPTRGMYFQYKVADNGVWSAVCADKNNAAPVATDVKVDSGSFHRFRIVSTNGYAYFYVDYNDGDAPHATIPVALSDSDHFAPAASVLKTGGTTAGVLNLDYFALRWEVQR